MVKRDSHDLCLVLTLARALLLFMSLGFGPVLRTGLLPMLLAFNFFGGFIIYLILCFLLLIITLTTLTFITLTFLTVLTFRVVAVLRLNQTVRLGCLLS